MRTRYFFLSCPVAYLKSKTTFELLRAKLVFTMCGQKWLVDRSDAILKRSYQVFGHTLTNAVLKVRILPLCFLLAHSQATFFGHFCAGEDEKSIKPKVDALQACGVGSILDYAAEADVKKDDKDSESVDPNLLSARTFEYQGTIDTDGNLRME